MPSYRIAVTADLHWGHGPVGDSATAQLRDWLRAHPPDLLLLGGDLGTREHFSACLSQFAELPCKKVLVPGNHDIWVAEDDPRGDSLTVYREHLPTLATASGFHYLDHGPLLIPEIGLAVVGCMNWYDYSWTRDRMPGTVLDWQERLAEKRFTRGRHNDGRFVRWPTDDVRFTAKVVETFRNHLEQALSSCERAIVLTHHPAFLGLSFPRPEPMPEVVPFDWLLWDALAGNAGLEVILAQHADRIPLAFSGHTHRERASRLGGIQGYNVGGDYQFKRLLVVEWPERTVTSHVFGQAP